MRSFRDSIHENRQFTCSLTHSLKGYWSQKWANISCLSATNMHTSKILSCCLSWPWLCVGDSWSVRDTVYTCVQMATAGFTGKVLWNMNRLTPLPEPSPPSSLSIKNAQLVRRDQIQLRTEISHFFSQECWERNCCITESRKCQ